MSTTDTPVEEQPGYIYLRIAELRARYDYSPKLKKCGEVDSYRLLSPQAMKKVVEKHCSRHNGWWGIEPERKRAVIRYTMKLIRQDSAGRAT